MKSKTRVWLIAIGAVLLIATTYEVVAVYYTPPSYLSMSRVMLAGKLQIDPPPAPDHVRLALLIAAVYAPSLVLLYFGIFFRRKRRVDA